MSEEAKFTIGYFPYFAKPGELELWAKTEAKSAVTLDVRAGKIYYVKGTGGVGFIVRRPHLMVVPESVGETENAGCRSLALRPRQRTSDRPH